MGPIRVVPATTRLPRLREHATECERRHAESATEAARKVAGVAEAAAGRDLDDGQVP